MTSDGAALFRTICEQPWEDTPRLIYADWLDENDEPLRAEFIRVQVAAANTTDKTEGAKLKNRAKELQRDSHGAWTRGSPRGPGVRVDPELRRGFYNAVEFPNCDRLIQLASAVFDWTPVDSVRLLAGSETQSFAKAMTLPYWSRVQHFALSGAAYDAELKEIADCPYLGNLASLGFSPGHITEKGVLRLAESQYLPKTLKLTFQGRLKLRDSTVSALKDRFPRIVIASETRR